MTPEGRARGIAFEPRPTDVFIATHAKSGTTLLQQIVHGLRTGGDMDFVEITEVVPWIEMAHDIGLDPEAEQRAPPRAYKTHLDWAQLPKGGRVIYAVRDPLAVLVSFYHFLEGWFFEPGAIDLESFAFDFVLPGTGSGRYWEHLVSWWPERKREEVLAFCYEDLVEDLPRSVARIAGFIRVEADDARLEVATRQAHIDFMSTYPTLWDDNLVRAARNAACGVPRDAGGTKVRPRNAPPRAKPTPEIEARWQHAWSEIVEPATGLACYADLRRAISSER
jgi:hypothetical protein